MKKILLSLSLIFGFIGYVTHRNDSRLFIKNSKIASSQMTESATFIKTNVLSDKTQVANNQSDIAKKQTFSLFDDFDDDDYEDDDYEDDGDEGNEKNQQMAMKFGTVSSKTSQSQTSSSEKSSAQSMPMMNMRGKMMVNEGQYRNGEYAGSIADAYYGNVQVKAIISGGKIVDVQFLDYPHIRQNSIRINTYAMPILKSEVIKFQSAEIDAVSGASATSGAFKESLASALARAKI